jgi:integrase
VGQLEPLSFREGIPDLLGSLDFAAAQVDRRRRDRGMAQLSPTVVSSAPRAKAWVACVCRLYRWVHKRHTHATHALAHGAELTTVRDNLRHASIATTSIYLQGDEIQRAGQMNQAFAARK